MGLDLPIEFQVRYLSKRSAEILCIKKDLEYENYDSSVLIGHRLKGSGETFGFPLITKLGSIIEKAGQSQNKKLILETLDKLEESVLTYQVEISHS